MNMNMNHPNPLPRSMHLLEVGVDDSFQSPKGNNKDTNLQNTLFNWLYPQGHIGRLSLRSALPSSVPAVLDEVLSGIRWQGITYMPVGSKRSIENQELYLIDEYTHGAVANRFHRCSAALIAQFDLFVSSCDIVTEQELTVMVVSDAIVGHNDWYGWIRQSMFSKLGLPSGKAHYPFVMGFGEMQGKGEFGVMDDAIADRHHADIIIPRRCLKPATRTGFGKLGSNRFVGRVVLGLNQSPGERDLTDGINNLLDEHVCESRCNAWDSQALRHVLMRAFKVREMYAVKSAGK
jgi:hypothetical protein